MLTLWDLLEKNRSSPPAPPTEPIRPPTVVVHAARVERSLMRDRYTLLVREALAEHRVRVRRWRSSMSGCAWEVHYADGRIARLIEAPRPRGPMSAAVFLHEVGHHAIGFHRYKPRCLEEYHAWAWALAEMERRELNITDAVRRRMHESLQYAVMKARRRGIKRLPPELLPYQRRWRARPEVAA
ncbi:MAG: hypothetical protein ACF8QF_05570 [Phycisphaerales bacterium]